jgi:hypothetical protein
MFRREAARRGRTLAFALAALICGVGLAGCGTPTLKVVSSGVDFEGGCDVVIQAANLTPGTKYEIGMWTTGAPVVLGDVTTNAAGSFDGSVGYPSNAPLRINAHANVEVYTQAGAGIVSAPTGQVPVCLPAGLAR